MKNRTLNEIRQSKEYQTALQGGDFIKPTNKPAKSTGEVMLEDYKSEGKYEDCTGDVKTGAKNPFEHEWFEFYHENHGKIMHKLLQNLK